MKWKQFKDCVLLRVRAQEIYRFARWHFVLVFLSTSSTIFFGNRKPTRFCYLVTNVLRQHIKYITIRGIDNQPLLHDCLDMNMSHLRLKGPRRRLISKGFILSTPKLLGLFTLQQRVHVFWRKQYKKKFKIVLRVT